MLKALLGCPDLAMIQIEGCNLRPRGLGVLVKIWMSSALPAALECSREGFQSASAVSAYSPIPLQCISSTSTQHLL